MVENTNKQKILIVDDTETNIDILVEKRIYDYKIFLNNLSKEFVNDLMEKSIPIGTLWFKYKMETFKKIINQY